MALLVSSVISDCNVPLVHSVLPALPPCSPASNSFHFSSFQGHKEQRLSLPPPLPLFSSVCVSMCVCVCVFRLQSPLLLYHRLAAAVCLALPPQTPQCRDVISLSLSLSPLSFTPAAAPYRSILFVFVPFCLHGDVFSSIRPPVYLRSLDAAQERSLWPVQYSVYGFFFFYEV